MGSLYVEKIIFSIMPILNRVVVIYTKKVHIRKKTIMSFQFSFIPDNEFTPSLLLLSSFPRGTEVWGQRVTAEWFHGKKKLNETFRQI